MFWLNVVTLDLYSLVAVIYLPLMCDDSVALVHVHNFRLLIIVRVTATILLQVKFS